MRRRWGPPGSAWPDPRVPLPDLLDGDLGGLVPTRHEIEVSELNLTVRSARPGDHNDPGHHPLVCSAHGFHVIRDRLMSPVHDHCIQTILWLLQVVEYASNDVRLRRVVFGRGKVVEALQVDT